MSLEAAIAENTAALREVVALITRLGAMPGPDVVTPAAVPANAKPAAKPPAPTPAAEAEIASAPEATYDDVKRAIIEVSKAKGRDAAVALLAEFGATKAPDLKPEQYAALRARAAEVLA